MRASSLFAAVLIIAIVLPINHARAGEVVYDLIEDDTDVLNAWPGPDGLIGNADDLIDGNPSPINGSEPNPGGFGYNAFDFVGDGSVMVERFRDPAGPDARAADAALADFFAACREHALPVAVVLFPDLGERETYALRFLHDRVVERCKKEGVPSLDLEPVFAAVTEKHTLQVNAFDSHPGAEANRVAAERILDAFGPLWIAAPTLPAP